MSIIKTVDVKKWFGDFQALKGISMEVAEGEVVIKIFSMLLTKVLKMSRIIK